MKPPAGKTYDLTPAALRAARALLQMGIRDLAAAAGVDTVTINAFELGRSKLQAATAAKIEAVLSSRGIELVIQPNREGAVIIHAIMADEE